jgi:hypothetical protein
LKAVEKFTGEKTKSKEHIRFLNEETTQKVETEETGERNKGK